MIFEAPGAEGGSPVSCHSWLLFRVHLWPILRGYSVFRMLTKLLKAKIHRATVTFTDVEYPGSVTIDPLLLESAGLLVNEAVLIADCDNGHRFETYIIPGEVGSGTIGINGAAARLTAVGHKVIILAFGHFEPHELEEHKSRVLLVDEENRLTEVIEHGTGVPGVAIGTRS